MAGRGIPSRNRGDDRNQRGREVIVGDLAGAALAESRGVGVDISGVVCSACLINQLCVLTEPEVAFIWHTYRSWRTNKMDQTRYHKLCEAYALQT